MIDVSEGTYSLSDFKRRRAEFVARMRNSGRPVILTINGRAELVVQDAASYQRLLEQAERTEMIEFIRDSRDDMKAGRTESAVKALERLAKKHGLT
jgi:prevent-host-death family protein